LAQGTIKPFVNISWNGRHPIGFKYLFWRGRPGPAQPAQRPAGLWRPDVL